MKQISALALAVALGLSLASAADAQAVLPGFAMPETVAPVTIRRGASAPQFRAEARSGLQQRAPVAPSELAAFPGRDR